MFARSLALILVLLLACGSAFGDSIIPPPGGATVSIPNYTPNGGLPHWKSVRNNPKNGTSNVQAILIGDSTTAGYGSFFNSGTNEARPFSWPVQLAALLNLPAYNMHASAATVMGLAGQAATTAAYQAWDKRWPTVNSWTASNDATGLPGSWVNATNTTKLTFNPADTTTSFQSATVPADTLDIYGFIGGVSAYNVDVGSSSIGSCVPSQIGTTFIGKCTFSTGAAPANNVWNIGCNPQSGYCVAVAMRAYNNTAKEISIFNSGVSGATASTFTAAGGSTVGQHWIELFKDVAPDLCTIDLTINDANYGTIASGTYNSASGVITLTMGMSQATIFSSGNITISSLTGTGANLSTLNGTWATTSVSGTTITAQGPTGKGTITITGGVEIPATYTSNLQQIITACEASGDVLMISGNPSNPASVPYTSQAAYVAAFAALATSNNLPYLDMWTNFGGSSNGWLTNQQNGYNAAYGAAADPYHLGMVGYATIANFVAQVLMQ